MPTLRFATINQRSHAYADGKNFDPNHSLDEHDDDQVSDPATTGKTTTGTTQAITKQVHSKSRGGDENAKAKTTVNTKITGDHKFESNYRFVLSADTKTLNWDVYASGDAVTACEAQMYWDGESSNSYEIVHFRATFGLQSPLKWELFAQEVKMRARIGPYNDIEVQYNSNLHMWQFQGVKLPSTGIGPAENINLGVPCSTTGGIKTYDFYRRVTREQWFQGSAKIIGNGVQSDGVTIYSGHPLVDIVRDVYGAVKLDFMGFVPQP